MRAEPPAPHRRLALTGAFLALITATAAAYLPGLSGGFLFDDTINLRSLGAFGPIDDLRTLLLYLTSGTADPTGRPVSLLSFLVDARNWPAAPAPFKRTNLGIHLLNGLLLFLCIRHLERRLRAPAQGPAGWVALLAAALWLAHPLFVSTTLYIVQRHAMLPMTFTLSALLLWCHGWEWLQRKPGSVRALALVAGTWLLVALAGLSKANGFLAPLLLLVVHWAVLAKEPGRAPPVARAAFWAALVIPAAAVLVALAAYLPTDLGWKPHHRDWTAGERLLTQSRVLWDYLRLLGLPRIHSGGLYVEGFPPSRGWLEPWTTLPAVLGLAALAATAVLLRRRLPSATIAILVFLVGHSVEASTIPLELYFEHRNYLPAAFLFWPLAQGLLSTRPTLPRLRKGLAVALPCLLLLLTWQRATVWGDPRLQATLWGASNETSLRAQTSAATALAASGQRGRAVALLHQLGEQHPGSVEIAINRIAVECPAERLSEQAVAGAERAFGRLQAWRFNHYDWLERMVAEAGRAGCPAATEGDLDRLIHAAGRSPGVVSNTARRQNWWFVLGLLDLRRGQPDHALARFNETVRLAPDPERALVQAATLGNWGWPRHGADHLDYFSALQRNDGTAPRRGMRSVHQWLQRTLGYYESELSILRAKLARAAAETERESPAAKQH